MLNCSTETTNILRRIRSIRRSIEGRTPATRGSAVDALLALERDLAPMKPEDYATPQVTYETVLGYLARTNPEALDLMVDPIKETCADGRALTKTCIKLGIPNIQMAPGRAVTTRYPQLGQVKAYPTEVLDKHFGNEPRVKGNTFRPLDCFGGF